MPKLAKTRRSRRATSRSRTTAVRRTRKTAPTSRARSSARRKRQPRRIFGLRWHHFGGLTILIFGTVAFLIAQPAGKSMASSNPPSLVSATAPSGYSEVWGDEFNGSSVDSNSWNELNDSNYGASSNQDQCYEAGNITEAGGTLNITADDDRTTPVHCGGNNPDITSPTTGSDGKSTANNYFFTSGFLTTRDQNGAQKYSFQYGYIEAAIEMPKGNPYWGAFWLVGDDTAPAWPDYGEFDIVEQHGIYPDNATGTIHYPGACSGNNCSNNGHNLYNILDKSNTQSDSGTQLTTSNYSTYSGVASSTFVRYGFLWQPTSITWYINGYPLRTLDTSDVLTVYTAWDSSGNPIASTTTTLTAPSSSYPFSTIFAYYHTIDLNLAVGGSSPIGLGYTGIESADGTSYNSGNLTTQGVPGTMKVDYLRVYQADTTPPTVSLSSPTNGATVSGTTTVSGTASDNVGVSNVELFVDGQQVSNDTVAPYSFSLDTTGYSNGSHSLYLEAFDGAGNHTNSSAATITVDNTAPGGSGNPGDGSGGSSGGGSSSKGGSSTSGNPVTTISVDSPSSSTPIPVKGDLKIAAAPGISISITVDGQAISGDTINTSQLTNGKHIITITEDGKTKTQAIVVDNPLPMAIRNYLRVHKVIDATSTTVILVAFLLVWFFRRRLVNRLLPLIPGHHYARFTAATVIKPRR